MSTEWCETRDRKTTKNEAKRPLSSSGPPRVTVLRKHNEINGTLLKFVEKNRLYDKTDQCGDGSTITEVTSSRVHVNDCGRGHLLRSECPSPFILALMWVLDICGQVALSGSRTFNGRRTTAGRELGVGPPSRGRGRTTSVEI